MHKASGQPMKKRVCKTGGLTGWLSDFGGEPYKGVHQGLPVGHRHVPVTHCNIYIYIYVCLPLIMGTENVA